MFTVIKHFCEDESGPTPIEYGLLVALLAVIIALAALVMGTNLSALSSEMGDRMRYAVQIVIPVSRP
jgi:Flp pilus assembly pilin Flp